MRTACHTNDLFYESVSIFCMIPTSSSYIEVIKAVKKTPNNILSGVPAGTAASRDETPCIRSTHNTIAVLRPCRLKAKSHRWNGIGKGIFTIKPPVDCMLTRETWLASVSAQLRDRLCCNIIRGGRRVQHRGLQYSCTVYCWSQVYTLIGPMFRAFLPRAISTRYCLKINDEKEQFLMDSGKKKTVL